MSFNHSVSDLVAIIKNGYSAGRQSVLSPVSKLRENILFILKDEGYILNYAKIKKGSHDFFSISLKYYNQQPVLTDISVVSKPGRKIYCNSKKIPLVKNGLGMLLLSTSQGVIADHIARTKNLGGEILLKIF
ncbi:MAG: 30S ribosomal protein S8 [Alphaproteobacteria bacterium]|nr:30S ribosomal protein S8 [Alphaproteobacteria bacterium]